MHLLLSCANNNWLLLLKTHSRPFPHFTFLGQKTLLFPVPRVPRPTLSQWERARTTFSRMWFWNFTHFSLFCSPVSPQRLRKMWNRVGQVRASSGSLPLSLTVRNCLLILPAGKRENCQSQNQKVGQCPDFGVARNFFGSSTGFPDSPPDVRSYLRGLSNWSPVPVPFY